LSLDGARLTVRDGDEVRAIDLASAGVLMGEGTFDPPTTPLDADGQGVPYATYAFAAQMATVEVDIELGTVKVLRIVAAHDVGKAINPTLVEGQIQGGVAQGLGLALMEEYLPGRTENLHDYLIPTIGDVPDIECILIEDREPLGPSGAKGVGEPGLVPTAPAILGAVHHATGVRATRVPLLPHRLREALLSLPNEVGEVSAQRTEGSKASPLMPMTPPALRATSPASLGRKEKR
jgi:CO/xanthine dehydrogenase Mo-binding subunit